MEKIVISTEEISVTAAPPDEPVRLEPKLQSPVPLWGRIALLPLILFLPVLCLVALVLRIAMRNLPPRTRYAWLTYLTTLLIVSGMLTSIVAVVGLTTGSTPIEVSQGLSDFDSRTTFPVLPTSASLSPKEVSEQLKPLVTVVTPARQAWFSHQELPSSSFGAGVLLYAGHDGYLVVTARHVIDGTAASGGEHALVAGTSGVWAGASVVARHNELDLLLLWLPRTEGSGSFVMPVDSNKDISDGDSIYVIGHPQGLRYTLSTGIISRTDKDVFQISAPVSPGNSGGPMFDDKGRLAGIVVSMIDKNNNPNSENLNFAVRADALLDPSAWKFYGDGRKHLDGFLRARKTQP